MMGNDLKTNTSLINLAKPLEFVVLPSKGILAIWMYLTYKTCKYSNGRGIVRAALCFDEFICHNIKIPQICLPITI